MRKLVLTLLVGGLLGIVIGCGQVKKYTPPKTGAGIPYPPAGLTWDGIHIWSGTSFDFHLIFEHIIWTVVYQ